MNIVIPMAGRGSRFARVGVPTPKPLINVLGRPMYSWAVESLPLSLVNRLIFICLGEHLESGDLARDIEARYSALHPLIIPLSQVTEGQACTVLEARNHIDNEEPLIIFNSDTYCRTDLEQRLPDLPRWVAGLVGVFQAPGDKWSFARADQDGRVLEMAEKRRISPWATTGLYHFSRGRDFVSYASAMIAADERVNNEFYVAPVYNRMITAGLEIRIDVAGEVWVLGTPEDLDHFYKSYPAARGVS